MSFILRPAHLLFFALAGLINDEQQRIIEFQNAQIRVLMDLQGRKALLKLTTLVTPDTILRWHRKLIADKWDYSHRKTRNSGRPRTAKDIEDLILLMNKENPSWGYTRIHGALKNLGHTLSDTTVANILKENGIEPVPLKERKMSWKTFLKAHWGVISAIDFTSVEVWTRRGLVTFYVLVAIDLKTRRINIAGITESPDGRWTEQMTRNLTGDSGFLEHSRYLIVDRDTKFQPLCSYLKRCSHITPLVLPPRSPNLNAYIERYMRSMKEECLNNMIFFGRGMLERTLREWEEHYHHERNHQGLDNELIVIHEVDEPATGRIQSKERLGGMLRYYYREAA